jgi:hypothetical protein
MKTTSGSKNVSSNSENDAKHSFSISETFGRFGTLLLCKQKSGRQK